ncbi:T9SS type A sorting domain-containing protein [Aestuariivivens sediminicola]|uniref:T9SS type A sorting domain-containing protein n=1 Tax=Aestuariivivens sediminicola TaxID=2913560 RepID=UPI001F595A0C|nr:T9SS type A sorting domain-containing protein [Aestuariivivens sediminicola]
MKKITSVVCLTLFAFVFVNAQVYSEDFESYSIGATNTDTGNQIQAGTGTVEVATASGNTSKILKAIHTADNMYVRSKSFGVNEGDIINVTADVATSNGIFVITMRNEASPYTQINASEAATCTNGSQSGGNPGRIVQTANEFGTVSATFTIPAGIDNARVQIYNFGSANTVELDNFLVELEPTASLEDLARYQFKSFPNPVKNVLNVSASKTIDKIEVYNLLGQQVLSHMLKDDSAQIGVSSLSNGVYLVKAFIEDAVGTYKFIKQ